MSLYITLMRHKFLQTKQCGTKELRSQILTETIIFKLDKIIMHKKVFI